MRQKIVSVFVCMLLIATVLSVAGTINNKTSVEKQSIKNNSDLSLTESDWWPMFGHDPQLTGYSTSSAPDTNNVLWSHLLGYDLIGVSSPVVVDNNLYAGTLGPISMVDYEFLDLSLDVFNGNVKSIIDFWKNFFLDYMKLEQIYGDNAPLQWPGKVYCLDTETGSENWARTVDGFIVSSPAVYDDKIYFPTIDVDFDTGIGMGKFFCLDTEDGDEIWSITIGEWEGVPASSPAIVDGKIYIPTIEIVPDFEYINESYFIGKFICLDAENGDIIWNHTFGEWEGVPASSPAIADGKIYIPTIALSLNWTYPEESVIIGKFICLDANDGDETWSHTFGEWEGVPASSPAIADGKVFIPTLVLDIDYGYINCTIYAFKDEEQRPPETPNKPNGPTNGNTNTAYTYSTSTTDPNGDQLKYGWDWNGDSIVDEWDDNNGDYYESGETVQREHSWSSSGTYNVKVKASDGDAESGWSTSLKVTIAQPPPPSTPNLEITDVGGLMGIRATIKNTGKADASNIKWTITMNGGLIIMPIGGSKSSTISSIKSDEQASVSVFVFGFGSTSVTVEASCSDSSDKFTKSGLILGPFILMV